MWKGDVQQKEKRVMRKAKKKAHGAVVDWGVFHEM
jgi:hypothetical protein